MSRSVAPQRTLCIACLLFVFASPIVAEDQLIGTALELAPIDTATFVSVHRIREQVDLLVDSRAFHRLVATNNSLISFLRMRMGLVIGEHLEGWKESVADE